MTCIPAGAAIFPPLSTVVFLDKAAAPGGNGSIAAPFNNTAAAVAALPVGVGGTIEVVPGDYTTEPDVVVPASTPISFVAMAATIEGTSAVVALPRVDWSSSAPDFIAFQNVIVTLIGITPCVVRARDSLIKLTSTSEPALEVTNCQINVTSGSTGARCASLDAVISTISPGAVGTMIVDGPVSFRACTFEGSHALNAVAAAFDESSAFNFQTLGWRINVLPTSLEGYDPNYGPGANGNVTISAGSVGLGENAYDNLTINGTGQLFLDRFILRVKNLLDLSAAPAAAIISAPASPGGNAAGSVAGAAGTPASSLNGYFNGVPGSIAGSAGATGVVGAGVASAAPATVRQTFGSGGGAAGASGAGTNPGAALAGSATIIFPRIFVFNMPVPQVGPFSSGGTSAADLQVYGSTPGRAGASGGGSGAVAGGGGGGSAQGVPSMIIYARGISRTAGVTPAGVIAGPKNNGGNGGDGAGANAGGGSGAGGTGGAAVIIVYDWLIGSQVANAITCPGGDGGRGGNGGTGAQGGNGGTGGDGGRVTLINRITGLVQLLQGSAGSAGGAALGTVGGTPGPGGTLTVNL